MRVRHALMERHFRVIAPQYRQLRELDARAVRRVSLRLKQLSKAMGGLTILDVGAGTGRYAEAVVHSCSERIGLCYHGVAYDAISEMLRSGRAHRSLHTGNMDRAIGLAEFLPFTAQSFNAVFSFNAIHHFDLRAFLAEAARVLQPKGELILYTRTPEQNQCTVWGRFFPHFAERETRLYTKRTLRVALGATADFESIELQEMQWTIRTSLSRLLAQARSGGYSTFRFYSPDEFEEALGAFETRVRATFDDLSTITAQNDHLLVLATRR
jgi:ubiquinone/menaquinone biosynthesis C-methylase UbiE